MENLQRQREKREQERATWAAINYRATLRSKGLETATEYGRALLEAHAERVTVALGLLLEELLANPNKPGPHFSSWPLLLIVNNRGPRSLALIALSVVIDHISQRPTERQLASAIGKALQDELKAGRVEERGQAMLRLVRRRLGRQGLARNHVLEQLRLDPTGWTAEQRAEVGMLLLQVIASNTDLVAIHDGVHRGRRRRSVEATDAAKALIKACPPRPLPSRKLPMLVPPLDWEGLHGGGHLISKEPLVRSRAGLKLDHLTPEAIAPLLRVVNTLQRQELVIDPWMVQQQRLAWNHNIRGLFPVTRDPLPEPPRPPADDVEAFKAYQRQRLLAQADRSKHARERARIEGTLQQCEEVMGLPIWFAYCADFRGRIYSSNRYATHQGPDWEKAAISFAQGEQCSVEAFEWMLKAAAGHYGIRGSWASRLHWGQENLEQLCAVAEAPLDRLELWREAKDPWQFLQLARAIAQQVAEPNSPCATPVRFDQTCSGIGISAALTRDRRLARLTNIAGQSLKDIYGHVAEQLQHQLRLELSNGTDREQLMAAHWLELGITRLLCKGPVMTTIYGAKHLGITEGLICHLEQVQGGLPVRQWEEAYVRPARYLTRKLSVLLGVELASCIELQTWLRNTCRTVLSKGHRLGWTSPMGFPIRLGDEHDARRNVITLTKGNRRWQALGEEAQPGELSARSTNRAATANFVHSFDAAHCQAIVSRCGEQGVPVLTNHDCFATPPARAGWLHRALHDELRSLYGPDWLAEVTAEIQAIDRKAKVQPPPVVGDLCPGEIGQNSHCFS